MLAKLADRTPANAYLFLTLTMLFWAGNYTIGRWAAGHVPPVTLAFLRWTGAALLILPFALAHMRREWPAIRGHWPILLALGITGSGLFNTLQYIALTGTTATNAGIINCASPVMIAVLSFFINAERVRAKQALGIVVSLAGVLIVIAHGDSMTLMTLAFNRGDLVMLFAMLIWAIYTALLDKRPGISVFSFAGVTYVIASALNLPLAAAELASGSTIAWSSASIAAIAYTAIFPSLLAYLCFNRGVEIIGPTRAGASMHLVPLFTVVLAVLFLGEEPAAYHAAGLLLILTGIWLTAHAAVPADQR
jgi:drug/metabolite transporter (DMT)-like permease